MSRNDYIFEEVMKTLFEARKKRIAAISEEQAGDKNQ